MQNTHVGIANASALEELPQQKKVRLYLSFGLDLVFTTLITTYNHYR
jgi:hypothetical protein